MVRGFYKALTFMLLTLGLATPVLTAEGPQGPLPKQVWASLKEARRAAVKNKRRLVMYVPEDETRYQTALAFFNSLQGMKARLDADVWLSKPGDPEAKDLLETFGFRSLPVLASLRESGKTAVRSRLGEDCVPLSVAFERILQPLEMPTSRIKDWIGPDQPLEPFLAFREARKKDLGSGACEPHRTWLVGLLASKDQRLRNWAATRLVESNAPRVGDEAKPFPILLKILNERFDSQVRFGNKKRSRPETTAISNDPNPPTGDLGEVGEFPETAPCWSVLRRLLQTANTTFSVAHYVLMAPNLIESDKDWILLILARESKNGKCLDPMLSPLYWIATDWLIVYGRPSDWEAFRAIMASMGWEDFLAGLIGELKLIPEYWNSESNVQSMFCEGETQESFWDHPDACLASWGITREALVEFGMDRLTVKQAPPPPRYPEIAKRNGLSTTLRLRILVGPDGRTKWVRPKPGFALSVFAPTGLAYAVRWQFEPTRVGGVARPSQFWLTLPFLLRPVSREPTRTPYLPHPPQR